MVVSWSEGQVVNGGVSYNASACDGEDEGHIAHGDGDNGRVGNESNALEVGGSWSSQDIYA